MRAFIHLYHSITRECPIHIYYKRLSVCRSSSRFLLPRCLLPGFLVFSLSRFPLPRFLPSFCPSFLPSFLPAFIPSSMPSLQVGHAKARSARLSLSLSLFSLLVPLPLLLLLMLTMLTMLIMLILVVFVRLSAPLELDRSRSALSMGRRMAAVQSFKASVSEDSFSWSPGVVACT